MPIGYQRVNLHMSFDFRMEDFRHKARLLVVGYVTEPTDSVEGDSEYCSDVGCPE